MAFELKERQATLHINKEATGNQPKLKVKFMLNNELWEMAFWEKISESGTKWYSGKVSEPYQKQEQAAAVDDESVPF